MRINGNVRNPVMMVRNCSGVPGISIPLYPAPDTSVDMVGWNRYALISCTFFSKYFVRDKYCNRSVVVVWYFLHLTHPVWLDLVLIAN